MMAEGIFYLILFILGLLVGSFLNVVIYRFPRQLSVISPRSSCPACEQPLQVKDLVPVLSYLLLRGRCRYCGDSIGIRYSLVELATAVLFVAVPWYQEVTLGAATNLFLLCLLLVISLIDIDFRRIPNVLLGIGLGTGVLLRLVDSIWGTMPWAEWADAGLGMLVGGGVMLVIFILGKGGMGAGDFKLMIMVGFFVGLHGVLLVLLLGFLLGGGFAVIMLMLRRLTRKDMVPFGPFLSLAVVIEVFWGSQILAWYLNL